MKRFTERLLLLAVLVLYLAASGCYASGGYVGYGATHDYYDEAFYRAPIDQYRYGFYGHP